MAETMKNTGIEWIGKIPEEWEIKRFKYCVEICNGRDYKDIEVDEGGYPVLGSGGEFARASKYSYNKPSVLLGRKGTIDRPMYYDKPFWTVDTMFYTKIPEFMNPRFAYYMATLIRFDYYSTQTALPSMTQTDLGSEKLPVPKKDEQKKIADFLDKQTSKIDAIIKTNEEQLEVLKKYKKSLITQTVTKGLLKNKEKKNKGIEWEISRLKYEVEGIFDIDHYMPDSIDKGIPYVMTGDLRDLFSQIDFSSCKQISESDYKKLSKKIKTDIGDIIFARYATIGTVCFVDVEIKNLISYSCVTIKTKKNRLLGKYLYYYLKSSAFIQEIEKYINSNTQGNVGIESLGKVYLPIPPLDIQNSIIAFLDEKCTKIDSLITQKQEAIETMQKYKKSLIYEYVTGKKRIK